MRKPVLLVALALPLATLSAGCGDSCDDLAPTCDLCTDADFKTSCEATVSQNNQDLCTERKGDYTAHCVGEQGGFGGNSSGSANGGNAGNGGMGNGGMGGNGGNGGTAGAGGAAGAGGGGTGGTAGAGGT